MTVDGVGLLVRIDEKLTGPGYVDILENNLSLSAKLLKLGKKYLFQQDNDPKVSLTSMQSLLSYCSDDLFLSQHTSKVAKAWFEKNKVEVMDWPSMSPDLNPIEHLWKMLKIAVHEHNVSNKEEAWEVCQQEWKKLGPQCKTLVVSMNRRCEAVYKAKGGPSKY